MSNPASAEERAALVDMRLAQMIQIGQAGATIRALLDQYVNDLVALDANKNAGTNSNPSTSSSSNPVANPPTSNGGKKRNLLEIALDL